MGDSVSTPPKPVALDEPQLRAAVHHLVAQMVDPARQRHGAVPGVGTTDWWTAPADVQLASLLVLAEAHLICVAQTAAARAHEAQQLKDSAVDISEALHWAAEAGHPVHTELARRRATPGPLTRHVDRAAAARWAATGTTTPEGETA